MTSQGSGAGGYSPTRSQSDAQGESCAPRIGNLEGEAGAEAQPNPWPQTERTTLKESPKVDTEKIFQARRFQDCNSTLVSQRH